MCTMCQSQLIAMRPDKREGAHARARARARQWQTLRAQQVPASLSPPNKTKLNQIE